MSTPKNSRPRISAACSPSPMRKSFTGVTATRMANCGRRMADCSRPPPRSRISRRDALKTPRIALLGIPIEIGASQPGTLMGPDALRTAGIGRVLEQLGFSVEDHGNLAIPAAVCGDAAPPANARYYDD